MPNLPSSLKWLMVRRSEVDGRIKELEKILFRYEDVLTLCRGIESQIAPLRELRDSLDNSLSLHEIKVDPSLIPPRRRRNLTKVLPYGDLTDTIIECLQQTRGQGVPSGKIIDFVAARMESLGYEPENRHSMSIRVGTRLRCLFHAGRVQRHHDPKDRTGEKARSQGIWSVPELPIQDIQSPIDDPGYTP